MGRQTNTNQLCGVKTNSLVSLFEELERRRGPRTVRRPRCVTTHVDAYSSAYPTRHIIGRPLQQGARTVADARDRIGGAPDRPEGQRWTGRRGTRACTSAIPSSGIGVRHRALTVNPYLPHNKRAHARQMPAKLKFRVVHASSEDPEFPSTELNAHSPHTVPSPLPPADRECAGVGARCRCEEKVGRGAYRASARFVRRPSARAGHCSSPAGHKARCVAYWWRAACFAGAGGMAERAILRIPTGARLPVCRARSPHAASGACLLWADVRQVKPDDARLGCRQSVYWHPRLSLSLRRACALLWYVLFDVLVAVLSRRCAIAALAACGFP